MNLLIFFAIIIGVIIFLSLMFVNLKLKLLSFLRKLGFSNLDSLINEIKKGEIEAKTNKKHVNGMTKLLLPKITKDFPNFSESELYTKVETSLLAIFNSIENKKLDKCDELILVREKLKKEIEDYKTNNINIRYDDVKFHEHAIKYYTNKNGAMNISISSSLEYYYTKEKDGKVIEKSDYKVQNRYTTEFIYVFDPNVAVKNQALIGINCPNCGAPVKKLGHKKCEFCGSSLEDINLKSWHISSYKADY